MIRITITAEAFEAIAGTLPIGNVVAEREANAKLKALRGPGESYSDVILRLAEAAQ
jgi:hypothetical protein